MNKKLLTVAIAGAMTAPMAAQAVKYKLSGQVNRAIIFSDDGEQSSVRNVDNIASGTRFRLRGSEDLGNGMQVGFYWEMQTSSAGSFDHAHPDYENGTTCYDGDSCDGGNGVTGGATIRHANVWFSGNWGKLTLGQADGVGNGATESDLSGTAIAGSYHGRTSFTGGLAWRTGMGGFLQDDGTVSATATGDDLLAGSTYTEYDSFSRYDQVRYDTPKLGPASLGVSIGNDNQWEVAGRVDTGLAGGQLSGALFYGQSTGQRTVDARYGGSVSFLFSQGTNITGAYAKNEPEAAGAPDGEVWSVKLGHKWGANAVSIGYSVCDDCVAGYKDQGFNIGFVHELKKANTEIYASYFHDELDTPAGVPSVEDHDTFGVGARVKFD